MIGSAPDPVESVTLFARLLRDAGLSTTPERVRDACEALLAINLERPDEVRYALRAVFVTRREEGAVFDAAFDLFFSRPGGEGRPGSIPGRSRPLALDPKMAFAWMNALGLAAPGVAREVEGPPVSSTGYSAEELLRRRDFRDMSWDELGVSAPAAPPVAVAGCRTKDPAPARRPAWDRGDAPNHASRSPTRR